MAELIELSHSLGDVSVPEKKGLPDEKAHVWREASWTEAVIEYKSYWDAVNRGEDPIAMQHFRQYSQLLEQPQDL